MYPVASYPGPPTPLAHPQFPSSTPSPTTIHYISKVCGLCLKIDLKVSCPCVMTDYSLVQGAITYSWGNALALVRRCSDATVAPLLSIVVGVVL